MFFNIRYSFKFVILHSNLEAANYLNKCLDKPSICIFGIKKNETSEKNANSNAKNTKVSYFLSGILSCETLRYGFHKFNYIT